MTVSMRTSTSLPLRQSKSRRLLNEFTRSSNPSFRDLNDQLNSSAKSIRSSLAGSRVVGYKVSESFSLLDRDIKRLFPSPAPSKAQRDVTHALVGIEDVFRPKQNNAVPINNIDLAVELSLHNIHHVFENPPDWASLLREHRTKATLTGGLTIRLKRPPRTPSLSPTPSLADSIQSSTEVEVERQSPCPPPRLERRSSSTTAALTLKRLRSPCVIPTPKRIRQCSPELGGTLYTTAPSPKQEPQRSRSPMVFPSPKHGWLEDQVRRTMRKQLRRVSHRGWEAYQ